MTQFDFPLDVLERYKPDIPEPSDFDTFWESTLTEARAHSLDAKFEPTDVGLVTLETYDVTFSGYGGQRIKGWLLLPKNREGLVPCVVEYIGYGGGRGHPLEWLIYASAGYAHFVMDTRGQGSSWRKGDTPDSADSADPQYPGFMTRGILSPEKYYYRRVYTDAVRAVEAAKAHEAVDGEKIIVTGGSQGGGISLAVAGLSSTLKAVAPDVPFLCHFKRATILVDTAPYSEIVNFLRIHRHRTEQVFDTLSYFDGVHFAKRASAPALFSVGLMDDICPPSTVYAAYNHYKGEKDIRVWEFNNHEGGQIDQTVDKLSFLKNLLKD